MLGLLVLWLLDYKYNFDKELAKAKDNAFSPMGFKNQRRNLRNLPQTAKGNTNKDIDARRKALLAGKRISKTGKIYWETRANRTDAKGSNI